MKKLLILALFLSGYQVLAQDSIRVMYYNLLNFPSAGITRYEYHRTILSYAKPDVFVVNELESANGANLVLDSSLNVYGTTHYHKANFIDGYDTDNCLYYNYDKLGLLSQIQVSTGLRDISVYRLYYKAPDLNASSDTIYLWFFGCHLKAGSSDYAQRNEEAKQVKFYLNDIADHVENVFVGGDFNFYSGYESGCQTLLNTGAVPLFDPVNAVGNWSGDWSYANWHSQSSRDNSFGTGTGGGLDDRFDLILVSEDVFNNENGVNYINGSFKPLGQDGNHFNNAVNSGINSAVPDSVANALYWSSDHLPVMLDIALDETASIPEIQTDYIQAYFDPEENTLKFFTNLEQFDLVIYDMMGREVLTSKVSDKVVVLPEGLEGVYVCSVNSQKGQMSRKIALY